MTMNSILTGYCPLGSGSGPIGALLMGSRMNQFSSLSPLIILLNSREWFAALVLNRYYSCVFESILSLGCVTRTRCVVDKKYRSKSSRHSSTDGDLSLPLLLS
jgi:hypothetical protein